MVFGVYVVPNFFHEVLAGRVSLEIASRGFFNLRPSDLSSFPADRFMITADQAGLVVVTLSCMVPYLYFFARVGRFLEKRDVDLI